MNLNTGSGSAVLENIFKSQTILACLMLGLREMRCAMRLSRRLLICLLIGALWLSSLSPVLAQLAKGDKAFQDHNYAEALHFYRQEWQRNKNPYVQLQIIQTLRKLKKYDALLQELEQAEKQIKERWLRTRLQHLKALVYLEVPHQGFQRNGKIFRDSEHREGEYVYLYSQDQATALEAFRAARRGFEALRQTPIAADLYRDWFDFNRDFFAYWAQQVYIPSDPKDWPVLNFKAPMTWDTAWHPLQKLYVIYRENLEFAMGDRHKELQEHYRWAGFLLSQRGATAEHYPDRDPVQIFQQVLRDYKGDPLLAEIQLLLGDLYLQRSEYTRALETWQGLLNSPLKQHAQARIAQLQQPQLSLSSPGAQGTQQPAHFQLNGRNLEQVSLQVYQLPLEQVLNHPLNLYKPGRRFADINGNLGSSFKEFREHYQGKVADWQFTPRPEKSYAPFAQQLKLPTALPAGAYMLEAHGKTVHAAQLILITDVILNSKQDREKNIYFLSHAQSGQPLEGGKLYLKASSGNHKEAKVRRFEGKTDKNGIFQFSKTANDPTNLQQLEAFALWQGHYAISGLQYWSAPAAEAERWKVYASSERPLYRPGQTVYFRHLLRRYHNSSYQAAAEKPLEVRVYNPRGEEIYKQLLTSNRFGSVSGQLELPEDAALGAYRFGFYAPQASHGLEQLGQASFQVEAYKKPEFKVEVLPLNAPYPGEQAKVKVRATYLTGGPVKQGQLQLKVLRSDYYPYWGWDYWDEEGRYPGGGESQVLQQTLTLSETGEAEISFVTQADHNSVYTISAEVTDASRREVSQSAQLTVTQQAFFAAIQLERGFYQVNERLNAEINLRNANQQPVAQQAGQVLVERLKGKDPKTAQELWELVKRFEVVSDSQGRIFVRWQAELAGRYRLRFTARDAREKPVEAQQEFWVAGPDFDGQYIRLDGVELVTEKRSYGPGEKVRLLVQVDQPESTVWLTEESEDLILKSEVLKLKQRSRVLEIPIREAHQPNFLLAAVMVRDRKLHQSRQEIFAPASQQKLQIRIKPQQQRYQPGQTAELELEVKDQQQRPLETELSLGLVDEALFQIMPDRSPDIFQALYGQRRYLPERLQTSLYTSFAAFNQDDQPLKITDLDSPYEQNLDGLLASRSRLGDNAAPPPAPAAMPESVAQEEDRFADDNRQLKKEQGPGSPLAPTRLRSNFQDTAYWNPSVVTNAQGKAKVQVTLPDNLTTWRIQARGWNTAEKVGQAQSEVQTHQDIMLRLQQPRFLVETDEVVISANVHNETPQATELKVELKADPQILEALGPLSQQLKVAALQQGRVDWRFKVRKAGELTLTASARGSQAGDAVRQSLPVKIYGALTKDVKNGSIKNSETSGSKTEVLHLPQARKPEQTSLQLTLQPSLAATLLDALPYLAEYPYGCMEQTTSRFVPAVLVAHSLNKLGLSLEDLGKLWSSPDMQKLLTQRQLGHQPLSDRKQLDAMIAEGLKRLKNGQNSDGGWGWWPGGQSDTYITTYVLDALQLAQAADLKLEPGMLSRGLDYLQGRFKSDYKGELHLSAYEALVLSRGKRLDAKALEPLFVGRDGLNPYSLALLAQAYQVLGQGERAQLILRNLKSFVRETPDSASWDQRSPYWYWYGDRVETNATILQAFLEILPNDPVVPKLVQWLVDNRQGNRWHSTKDTARAIYGLTGWLAHSGELKADFQAEVWLNGKRLQTLLFKPGQLLQPPVVIQLQDKDLQAGDNRLELRKNGKGTLYYSAALEVFSQAATIAEAGNKISLQRTYARVKGEARVPLSSGELVNVGEEIEVKVLIKSPNDYEYLMFEDFKPAGFEAVATLSGYVSQHGTWFYRELRDDRVSMFVSQLPQGTQALSYRLRAETPGVFHALPHKAEAMYAPQIQANSSSMVLGVQD